MIDHKKRIQIIADNLRSEKFVNKIKKVVPEKAAHSFAEKIAIHVISEVSSNEKLAACSWPSIQTCVLECAALGLFPSELFGHVYLVPFKTKATIIVGYKGLMQILSRNENVSHIHARIVRSSDKFDVEYGLSEKLVHIPNLKEKGELTHVYAIITYRDGNQQFEVMDKAEIDKIKSTAKSQNFWSNFYQSMALKTVIRRLAKYLPISSVYEKALEIEKEEHLDSQNTYTYDAEYEDTNSDDFLIKHIENKIEN